MEDKEKDKPSFSLSFIVRFWVEPSSTPGDPKKLRGQIIHVPSGERCYVQRSQEILSFMSPYLEALGIPKKDRFWAFCWRWRPFRRD